MVHNVQGTDNFTTVSIATGLIYPSMLFYHCTSPHVWSAKFLLVSLSDSVSFFQIQNHENQTWMSVQ